ncbi:hypothetical protein GTY65_24425 [Streptomyces sp. SID8379]|uniref:hypothetical protein n=1 Tax=unclassified Streptomyces TaxID=2593676 RepID=UPI000381109A|nr:MULTISPECIES: hypothetical protein [unclassified Streptomyces]MYW67189.1 hypothetical protein [Streptomyces sp. SID8379]
MRGAPGFVDVGRWTAGTWTSTRPGTLLSLGYAFRGDASSYDRCGLTVAVGRRTWAVFTLYSRAEYRDRKRDPWAKASEEFQPLSRARSGRWGTVADWVEGVIWWW